MDLYLDQTPEQKEEGHEKTAGFAARLSESPENWPQELTSELFKQLPYLSDYDLNVNLDRADAQRGFAFGYADVASRTERPDIEHGDMGIPHLRIPVIGIERQVKPFSVFLDGDSVYPLTEERVRETLFNPSTFDLSAQVPRDPSLIEPLMPPQRSSMGQGGEYKMASAQEKVAGTSAAKLFAASMREGNPARRALARAKSLNKEVGHMHLRPRILGTEKRASLLQAIAPTISEKDAQAFIEKVAGDAYLRVGFQKSGVVAELVEVFDKTKRASADDRLAYIAEQIQPTVVTLQKLPGGEFLVKHANFGAVNPVTLRGEAVPEEEAAEAIGPEAAQAMAPGQVATMTAEPIELEAPFEQTAKPIDSFGEYKVMDTMGNQIMGWVFPETLAWDGSFTKQPLALFTNGSAFALQDSIVGDMVGKSTNLPAETKPVGEGVLFMTQGGNAICTQPITIRSAMSGPDGSPSLVALDMMGQHLQISFSDGLAQPQRISDVEYAFPKTWNFMRLNNQTQLQGGGQDMGGEPGLEEGQGGQSDGAPKSPKKPAAKKPGEKKPEKKEGKPAEKKEKSEKPTVQVNVGEQAKKEKTSATLFYNGAYQLIGGCGLDKLAAEFRYDLSPVDAECMLGLLGVDGLVAKAKVAEARRNGSVKMAGLKTLTTLGERYQGATKTAAAAMKEMPNLRVDLTKEAAELQDQSSVNNVLALNFINPENLSTFIDYIPELTQTSEKLSEMLLFSYLGMNELPEGPMERSIKNLENVISGLRSVAETGPRED